jgi:hypothetical protein
MSFGVDDAMHELRVPNPPNNIYDDDFELDEDEDDADELSRCLLP